MQCVWIKWCWESYMNTQDYNVILHLPALLLLFVSSYFMYNWKSCISQMSGCFMFSLKMISLHTIFHLAVKLSRHNLIYNVSYIMECVQKMGYFIAYLLHNWELFKSMYILSLHCITIFLYSVYELNGAESLTWTHKIIM